jgi:hypothetical protein
MLSTGFFFNGLFHGFTNESGFCQVIARCGHVSIPDPTADE